MTPCSTPVVTSNISVSPPGENTLEEHFLEAPGYGVLWAPGYIYNYFFGVKKKCCCIFSYKFPSPTELSRFLVNYSREQIFSACFTLTIITLIINKAVYFLQSK